MPNRPDPLARALALTVAVATLVLACSGPATQPANPLPPVTPIMLPPAPAADDAGALIGPTWAWQGTLGADDRRATPASPDRYTLAFQADGRVQVRADCNRGGARYELGADKALTIAPAALTKMGCPPGSSDTEFLRELGLVERFRFADGDLVLTLRGNAGSMRFSPLGR